MNSTNENQPKEEKIKRLIQKNIDGLEKEFWGSGLDFELQVRIGNKIDVLKELLKEIETL